LALKLATGAGKKYQWLALHELASRIFNHRPLHHDPRVGTQKYDGPWQFRDIDSSYLQKDTVEKRKQIRNWLVSIDDPFAKENDLSNQEWLLHQDSVPTFSPLLSLKRPSDGTLWYPLELSHVWREPARMRERSGRTLQRQITFSLGAWLLPQSKVRAFVDVVKNGEWTGMDITSFDYFEPFIGEFAWAPSFADYMDDARAELTGPKNSNNSQIRRFDGFAFGVARTVMRYSHQGRRYDCSLKDSHYGHVPSTWLARRMHLSWGRRKFEFVGSQGEILAYDPSHELDNLNCFIIDQEAFKQFLRSNQLAVVWLIIGEKLNIGEMNKRDESHPQISVFRHVFSMSGNQSLSLKSRTLGYLGHRPVSY
jgi:hypothetical protein